MARLLSNSFVNCALSPIYIRNGLVKARIKAVTLSSPRLLTVRSHHSNVDGLFNVSITRTQVNPSVGMMSATLLTIAVKLLRTVTFWLALPSPVHLSLPSFMNSRTTNHFT